MSYEMEPFAKILKKGRKDKNLSQQELSKITGFSQWHISKIESSEINLRVGTLSLLAKALDLKIVVLPQKTATMLQLEENTPTTSSVYALDDHKWYFG